MSTAGGVCDECRLAIRKLQQKLVCTNCEKKYHRTCVEGVTQDDFRSWKKDGSLEIWLCTNCKEGRQEPPCPPEGPLMVTTIAEDFIVLSWKPLVNNCRSENKELTYKVSYIEKNKEDIYECRAINSTLGDYLMCKVGGLSPGTEYRFSVQTKNNAGLSQPLTTENFISTKKKVCSASEVPTRHPKVEQIGGDFVVLSWKRAANSCNVGVVIFTVLSQTRDQAEPSLADSKIVEEEGKLFCKIISLLPGKEYKFFIEAKSSIGVIERYCTKEFVEIKGLCPPPPPIGPLSVKDVGQDYIVLSWNAPVGYDNYKDIKFIVSHQRKGDVICSLPVKSCRLGGFFVCKVENLYPWTEYRFTVQSQNCAGLSECLTTKEFVKTLDKKAQPLKPSSVTLESCGRDKVKVSWKLDPNTARADKCVVRMLTNISDWETVAETEDGQTDSVVITRDIVGPYWVGVAAVNDLGTGAATVVRHLGREPPSPPVGPLMVRNISAEDVTLSWQPPTDCEKYDKLDFRVSYSQIGSNAVIVSSSKCSKLGSFFVSKVEGLAPGTEYKFSVQAWNSDGFSTSLSCPTSVITREKKLPPKLRHPFVPYSIGEDFVQLSMALPNDLDPDDPVTFRVSYQQKDQDCINDSPCRTTESKGTMFCKVDGLSPGKEYRFSVEGENSAGVSEPLMTDHFIKTKKKKGPPCPPEELIVTETAENFIVLTWKPPVDNGSNEKDKLSYKVTYIEKNKEHVTASQADYTPVGDFFVCKVGGLSPGTEYRFSVQTKNSAGLSEPLTTESFISTKKKVPPGPPVGPFVTKDIEENHVVLTWHPPVVSDKKDLKDIKFKVKYCQKGQTNWKFSTVWGQLGSLYLCKVTGLSPGTEYTFSVQAHNGNGLSDPLTMVGFIKTKEKKVKPSAPRGPLVMSSVSSDSVVLSWRPPEVTGPCDVVQYVIAKRDPGGIWRDIRPNLMRYLGFTDEVVSYKVSSLQAAKEYQFAVRARNDIGDSKFLESQSVIHTKNLVKPLMPSEIKLQSSGPGQLKVSWKINYADLSTVDHCEIKMSSNNLDWETVAKTTDGQTDSLTITHQYTGLFYVGVAAVNDAGSSFFSSASRCFTELVNNALNKNGSSPLGMPDLPFFGVEEELIKARVITSSEHYSEHFKISSRHFGQLRLTKNSGLKIHLRFCFKHNVHEMPRHWPSIYVNAREVWPINAMVDLTRKCMAEPLDVTTHCYGPDKHNQVRINPTKNQADKQMTFCFSLSIVKEKTPQQLCDKLVANQMQPAENTRNTVKAQLGEDEEIAATSVHASLLCPIGKTKMRYPCRSRFCHHVQCLDAVTMVSMNAKKSPWTCQICDTACSFSDLVIDGLFTEILNTVPLSVNEVEFRKDGTWTYKGKKGDNSEEKEKTDECGKVDNFEEKEKTDECETSVIDLDLSNTLDMIDLTETDDEGTPVPKKEKQFKDPDPQSSDKIREPLRINSFIMNTANRIVEQVGRIRDLAFGTSGHDGLGENYQSSDLSHCHRNSNNYNANRNRNNQPYSRSNRPYERNNHYNSYNQGRFNGGNSGFNGGSSRSYYSSSYRSSSYRDYDDPSASYYNRSRWR